MQRPKERLCRQPFFLIAPKKAWQHSQSPGFKMHGTRLRHHDSGLLAVPENTVEKRSEHHRVRGKSCALFLEVGLCPKTVSGGFGTPPEDFSALCDLRERRVKSRETAVTPSWKHALELRKCRLWHPLSPSHIGGQIFFGANLTQAITCYWQTRRNRDSITFDEWVDLDL